MQEEINFLRKENNLIIKRDEKISEILKIPLPPRRKFEYNKDKEVVPKILNHVKSLGPPTTPPKPGIISEINEIENNEEIILFPSYQRMLKACATFHPDSITKQRMSFLAEVPIQASTFRCGISKLKLLGLIRKQGEKFVITDEGLQKAVDYENLPTDSDSLISMWKNKLYPSYQKMFIAVTDIYPNTISKEEISEKSNVPIQASTFRCGISKLKLLGLIEVNGDEIKANDELFE